MEVPVDVVHVAANRYVAHKDGRGASQGGFCQPEGCHSRPWSHPEGLMVVCTAVEEGGGV